MKVKFIFDSEIDGDMQELKTFKHANEMRYVISAYANDRRHKHAEHSEEWWAGFDEARKIFFEYCNEVNFDVSDL